MNNRFCTEIQVRVTDVNYGGHLGNDSLYAYFHEARVRFLRRLGLSEGDISDGVSLTQTEGHIEYKGEAFVGDILDVFVHIDEIKRARFRVNYEFIRQADEKMIGQGYAVLAAFDYETRRPKRLPDLFVAKVSQFQSN